MISISVALLEMIEETAVPSPYNVILGRETALPSPNFGY